MPTQEAGVGQALGLLLRTVLLVLLLAMLPTARLLLVAAAQQASALATGEFWLHTSYSVGKLLLLFLQAWQP